MKVQAQSAANSGQRTPTGVSSSALTSSTPPASRTISGRVVNALNGMAVPRALVRVNSRQVLTDSQGRFELPQFTDQQADVVVTKPGYNQSNDSDDVYAASKFSDLDAPMEVVLYPDALVTGSVSGSDGQPLSQVQVSLRRATYDLSGLRWMNAGFTLTTSRGEYRFLARAGRYRVSIAYAPHTRETGDAMLPLTFPETSPGDSSNFMEVAAGEEKHVDLRPRMGEAHPVLIQVDAATDERPNLRFSAEGIHGDAMNLGYTNGTRPGEYRIELPSGSYTVRVQSDTREQTWQGAVRVTVAGQPLSGLVMHLAPAASLPVQVAVDPASSPQNLPTRTTLQFSQAQIPIPQQFNLYLRNLDGSGDGIQRDINLQMREDKTFEFRAPPGRYRLAANGGGGMWYVTSATYGGVTDLLTSEINLAAGSAGAPISIFAGSLRGNIHGKVNLSAPVMSAWVYLLASRPSLALPYPVRTGSDGIFFMSVPVGVYSVVALERRVMEDLHDSEVLARLTAGAKTIEVTAAADTTISVELSRSKGKAQ